MDFTFWNAISEPEHYFAIQCHWCASGAYAVDLTKVGLQASCPCKDCEATGMFIVDASKNIYRAIWDHDEGGNSQWEEGELIGGPDFDEKRLFTDLTEDDIDPLYG